MTITVPALGLAYFAVPKNACTTLKHACFALNTGRAFETWLDADGRPMHIHDTPGYLSPWMTPEGLASTAGLARLAVIRDPIRRLVSCWKNRVRHYCELSAEVVGAELLAAHGLQPTPPFAVFIERLTEYRAISRAIAHHTELQVAFLGRDPAVFAHIRRVEDMPALVALLSDLAGRPVTLGHDQTGGSEFPDPEIDAATRRRMLAYAEEDYDHWRFD